MVADLDVYRAANLLIEQHGADDAKLHAAQRADELLAKADLDGCRAWRLIFKAIGDLASTETPPGTISDCQPSTKHPPTRHTRPAARS